MKPMNLSFVIISYRSKFSFLIFETFQLSLTRLKNTIVDQSDFPTTTYFQKEIFDHCVTVFHAAAL